MGSWYNRPGSYQDRGNVSVGRMALLLIVAGVVVGVVVFVLFALLLPIMYTKVWR